MKKILGISLVAMMAVTTARADIASKAYVTVDQSANKTYNVINKESTPGVQLEQLDAKFGTITGTVAEAINTAGSTIKSVKVNGTGLTTDNDGAVNVTVAEGATNGTVAVNGTDVAVHGLGSAAYTADTAYDAAGTAAAAVAALDATVSQTAAAENGQLALSVTEENGKITAVSGSIAANTYDAHGAAAGVEEKLETDTPSTNGYDINAKTLKVNGQDVKSFSAGTNVSFGTADANGVVPINADYTYTLSPATASVLGGVKDGDYVTIDANGVISADVATENTFGVVKAGTNITNTSGTLSVADASTTTAGVVEFADSSEITAGTASKAVDAAQLKAVSDVAGTAVQTVTTSGSGNVVTGVTQSGTGVTVALDNAIMETDSINENGTYVLTATRSGDAQAGYTYTYQWENITRAN